jgi:ATP:ADP antiporter, AAA family
MRSGRSPIPALVLQAFFIAVVMMAWQVAAKTTRDSLFLSAYDPVTALPPMMVAASIASILMAVVNAKLLHRYGPSRVIPIGFLLGAALHGVEYVLLPEYPGPVAIAVYIHVVAIGSVLLSGFWALANERFDPREARKRFGQIAAFGTVGVLIGGVVTGAVSKLVSTPSLLIMLAGLQVVCALALFAFAASGRPVHKREASLSLPDMISGAPYLVGLASFVLLAAMSASSLDYLFKSSAKMNFAKGAPLTGFLALFNTVTAVLTFGVQVGGSKMWLKRFGPGKTVATLPVAVTGATLAAMFAPGLIALTVSRAIELLLRGSLYRSGYELFYTPMPASEKRSIKGVIDIGAERLGDGLAGAAIKLLVMLPGSSSVILGFTAILSAVGAWLAFRLDHAYVKVLEKGLANHTVAINPDQIEDSVTQSVVLKTMSTMVPVGAQAAARAPVSMAAPAPVLSDPALRRLAELRSGDPVRIIAALQRTDVLEPIVVPQVIELLDRDDVAQVAYLALTKAGDRIAGQLVDALQNKSAPYNIRKRLPKVMISCQSRVAWDGLLAHLTDERFEVRARCAKALERILTKKPEFRPPNNVIFDVVRQELSTAQKLSHSSKDSGLRMEEALKDRAAKSIAHIFTLLGLVLPPQPVRLAFRALRAEDGKLQGVALEYLDSVLPHALREQLSAYFEGTLAAPKGLRKEEALAKLLESNPSIMQRAEDLHSDPSRRPSPKKGSTTVGGV